MSGAIPYGFCHCGCGERTRLAPQSNTQLGWIRGEPIRFIVGHAGRVGWGPQYQEEDRGHNTPCWIWLRRLTGQGYGAAHDGPRKLTAHKLFYERKYGPVPEGLELDHLCRVRSCVNPEHLEAVTHAENCRRGANAKVTAAQAAEIRALPKDRWAPSDVAAAYGITPSQAWRIRQRKAWREEAA